MERASLRSTPEQKALPAPVIATTETSGSTSAAMIADRSAEDNALDSALRRSGRFRVSRRIWLAVVIWRTSSSVVMSVRLPPAAEDATVAKIAVNDKTGDVRPLGVARDE